MVPFALRFEPFFCEGIPALQLLANEGILPNGVMLLQIILDRVLHAVGIGPTFHLFLKRKELKVETPKRERTKFDLSGRDLDVSGFCSESLYKIQSV